MWILFFIGCGLIGTPSDETSPPAATSEPLANPQDANANAANDDDFPSTIILDNTPTAVRWDDGDTFAANVAGTDKPVRARLNGFNTLESYGPVHKWGRWKFRTLFAVAKKAGERAASETWTCTTLDGEGGYGRLLVDCPDLRLALIQEGLAHNFAVDAALESKYVAAQEKAVADKVGMWAKGAPKKIVTSLHSASEKRKSGKKSYDRVVSVRSGEAEKFEHEETYEVCQRVCHGGSCMVYVPFELRHGPDMADCLTPSAPADEGEAAIDAVEENDAGTAPNVSADDEEPTAP